LVERDLHLGSPCAASPRSRIDAIRRASLSVLTCEARDIIGILRHANVSFASISRQPRPSVAACPAHAISSGGSAAVKPRPPYQRASSGGIGPSADTNNRARCSPIIAFVRLSTRQFARSEASFSPVETGAPALRRSATANEASKAAR